MSHCAVFVVTPVLAPVNVDISVKDMKEHIESVNDWVDKPHNEESIYAFDEFIRKIDNDKRTFKIVQTWDYHY